MKPPTARARVVKICAGKAAINTGHNDDRCRYAHVCAVFRTQRLSFFRVARASRLRCRVSHLPSCYGLRDLRIARVSGLVRILATRFVHQSFSTLITGCTARALDSHHAFGSVLPRCKRGTCLLLKPAAPANRPYWGCVQLDDGPARVGNADVAHSDRFERFSREKNALDRMLHREPSE